MGGVDRKPRGAIALIANYASDVGYAWWLMENFWARIGEFAQSQGRRCLLAYPKINTVPAAVREAPIEVEEFALRRDGLGAAFRGARFLRERGVSTVYLTDWPFLHWCYLLWRLYGVRRIVLHDHAPGARPAVGGWRGLLKRCAFALPYFRCDQYVAVSRYVGERHRVNARVPAKLDVVVENGIHGFDPSSVDRAQVRARIGVPANAFLVVLVSRATYYKGIDFAVRAFAALSGAAHGAPVYAVHCGDGPDLDAFAALARELHVDKNFLFLGKRNDVREILSSSDVAFHPSKGEAMSLAILEFMCAGLPSVLPDDPSVCTSVKHESSGLVFRAGDVGEATRCLQRLYEDRALTARLGAEARRSCLENYLLEHANAAFGRKVVALM